MKSVFYVFILAISCSFLACNASKQAATSTTTNQATLANMDTPGAITWAAANQRYSANGKFNKWKFTKVEMQKGNIESLNASLNIDLTSIWEKSDKLTEHLKAWDYFDVEKFQNATLDIMNIKSKGGNMYEADLALSMRDKMQKMKSTFELVDKKTMRVKGTADVDRSIFGIGVENTSVPNLITVTYDTVIPR